MVKVIKRDGQLVDFDILKIINAINKAFLEVDKCIYELDTTNDIANEIKNKVAESKNNVHVEQIQDWIEDALMASERKDVARTYIRYRYKKEVARNCKDDFMEAVSEKLRASNVQNQNANVDESSFGGRIGEAASLLTKKYALDYIVSPKARRRHENNEIYIHKLNCGLVM